MRESGDFGLVAGVSMPLQVFDRNRGNIEAAQSRLAAADARRASAVQEALGEHRDLALVLAGLPDASARVTAEGGNAFALGRLAALGDERLTGLLRTARRRMRRLRD